MVLVLPLAACGPAAPAASSSQTVKVAYVGAITGNFAAVGLPIGNSVQLAVEQAAPDLAKMGITLQYVPGDDQMDAAQTPQIARKVAGDNDVIGVVGPMFGIDTNPAAPILTQAGLVQLTPGATAADLTTHGWTFYRLVPNDDIQGAVGAQYILKVLKLKKMAVIDDSTQYGHGVSEVVQKQLVEGGATITDRESVDDKSDDYSPTIAKVISSGSDGVYMGGSITVQYTFVRQLREKGFKGPYVAPDGALSPDFPEKAGPGSEGSIVTCQCAPVPAYGGPASGPLADYVNAYKAKFNSEPQAYSPEGYDGANLIIAAIKAGKKDRAGVLDYVKNAHFQGVAKNYAFQTSGELQGSAMNIYQVKNGKIAWLGISDDLIK
jgi:branched-chain amino acid transport system substrate-binding protein